MKLDNYPSNPLGLIAIFATLCEAFATILFPFIKSNITDAQKWILFLFIILFPIGVFCVFIWILLNRYKNLFGPSDFKTDEGFLNIMNSKQFDNIAINKNQDNLNDNNIISSLYEYRNKVKQKYCRDNKINENNLSYSQLKNENNKSIISYHTDDNKLFFCYFYPISKGEIIGSYISFADFYKSANTNYKATMYIIYDNSFDPKEDKDFKNIFEYYNNQKVNMNINYLSLQEID